MSPMSGEVIRAKLVFRVLSKLRLFSYSAYYQMCIANMSCFCVVISWFFKCFCSL